MKSDLVNTEVKNDLHILFLNNAPNNLLNGEFLDAIEASCELAQKKGARGILFLSKLKHFSGGADPDFFKKTDPSDRDPMRLIKLIESVAVPTVVGVNGVAVGGGFELALGCDLIVASKSASIGLVEVSVGLMPLSGGVQRVVQRAGLVRGKEIAMLGRRYDPNTLEKWGVINLVVDDATLHEASIALAQQVANGPTVALKEIKRIANLTARSGIAQADIEMDRSIDMVLRSNDAKSGVDFLSQSKDTILFKGV